MFDIMKVIILSTSCSISTGFILDFSREMSEGCKNYKLNFRSIYFGLFGRAIVFRRFSIRRRNVERGFRVSFLGAIAEGEK